MGANKILSYKKRHILALISISLCFLPIFSGSIVNSTNKNEYPFKFEDDPILIFQNQLLTNTEEKPTPLPSLVDKSSFSSSKFIIINHTKVSGSVPLDNFPILIALTDAKLKAKCQNNGNDIAFFQGNIQLDHEIEQYDSSTGTLVAWVKIPSLSPLADTKIQMVFGNPTIGAQANPTSVWSNEFQGVWHLNDNTWENVKDSTINGFDGIISDNPTSSIGKIGRSISFDGSSDLFNTGANASQMNVDGAKNKTVSAWAKAMNFWGGGIFDFDATTLSDAGTGFSLRCYTTENTWRINNMAAADFDVNLPGSLGNWVYFSLTYADGVTRLFANGTEVGNKVYTLNTANNLPFRIGRYRLTSFNGSIDEIRVASTCRSPDWIRTEYNNQFDPSSFYSLIPQPETTLSYERVESPNVINQFSTFSFSAQDFSGTGINNTQYRIDNNLWVDYTSPFNLSEFSEGPHTIYYFSQDNSDNEELIKSEQINLVFTTAKKTLLDEILGEGNIKYLIYGGASIAGVSVIVSFVYFRNRYKNSQKDPRKNIPISIIKTHLENLNKTMKLK
jgi:hypothetical protein